MDGAHLPCGANPPVCAHKAAGTHSRYPSPFAASISSPTNIFRSVECMAHAMEIGSPPKAGHVKHPAPKCFENTAFVDGHLVVTSPVVISPVILISDILSSRL